MALGNHHLNPIVEKSRTNPRSVALILDPSGFTFTDSTDAWAALTYDATLNLNTRAFTATGARTPSFLIHDLAKHFLSITNTADTFRGEITRGWRLTSVTMIYSVTIASLTSQTLTLDVSTVAHHVAPAASDLTFTTAAAAADQLTLNAQPKAVTYTPSANVSLSGLTFMEDFKVALATPNTCVYTFYGAIFQGDFLL